MHESLQDKCDWSPLDKLSSDHKPILTTMRLPMGNLKGRKRLVWDWKRGKLQEFTNAVESALSGPTQPTKIEPLYASFCSAVLTSARKHIGLKAVGMSGKCWMTREIAVAERERDRLRTQTGIHSEAFKAKDAEVKAML